LIDVDLENSVFGTRNLHDFGTKSSIRKTLISAIMTKYQGAEFYQIFIPYHNLN